MCEGYIFAAGTELDQPVSRGPVGSIRGSKFRVGILDEQSSHSGTLVICKCGCACESRECVYVSALVTCCLYQLKRGKGTWLSIVMFLYESYM